MKKILFLSNGHGEDIIAATLIKELKKTAPETEVSAFPVVGDGKIFEPLGIKILGPRKPMPSGGFIYHNLPNLLKDLTAGLLTSTLRQILLLRSLKGRFDLVVSIGDIVVIVGAILTGAPFIFIGCAKSDYYDYSYTPWEKWLLKKYCRMTFPRDLKTAENLKEVGIEAEYVGNPMMDALEITGDTLGIDPSSTVVGILPGSRADAYLNLEDLIKVSKKIIEFAPHGKKVEFLVALAEGLDAVKATKLVPADLPIKVIQGKFGDVLNRSDIVVGLSGTGNEQAVGLGKPVVCFPGRGVQHTRKFALDKKQLLSDSISLINADPSLVAQEVWSILKDPGRIEKMRKVGQQRMGGPGAVKKIVDIIMKQKFG